MRTIYACMLYLTLSPETRVPIKVCGRRYSGTPRPAFTIDFGAAGRASRLQD